MIASLCRCRHRLITVITVDYAIIVINLVILSDLNVLFLSEQFSPPLINTAKKHLSMEDLAYVPGADRLKHFHLRNQRNHRNQSMVQKIAQPDRSLELLQVAIDYADYS